MSTLSEINKDLRTKVASLERALGRSTFEFQEMQSKFDPNAVAAECEALMAALTVSQPEEAIDFYSRVLGAEEVFRIDDTDGRVAHAAMRVGESVFFISSEYPEIGKVSAETLGGTNVSLTINVPDAEKALEKALSAGCKKLVPLQKQFWGVLNATVVDPFGNHLVLSQTLEVLSSDEIVDRARDALRPPASGTKVEKKATKAA